MLHNSNRNSLLALEFPTFLSHICHSHCFCSKRGEVLLSRVMIVSCYDFIHCEGVFNNCKCINLQNIRWIVHCPQYSKDITK
ncbi:hypothetical protein GDO86_002107 [Hymenochirus boettgeri]|uniref:Uncharacterized protein n=1 Tax=Hymenochirus boettgeri TaxID=247094 RepID=A0A8T2KI54_9PIPI|nr:hypothetical protein GDO86_002107 [Hymenochirus boettgeri]